MLNPFTKQSVSSLQSMKQLLKLYINHYQNHQHKTQSGGSISNNKQNNICPICLHKIVKQGGGSVRESLQCNHLFHTECLQKVGEHKPCVICDQSGIYMNYSED